MTGFVGGFRCVVSSDEEGERVKREDKGEGKGERQGGREDRSFSEKGEKREREDEGEISAKGRKTERGRKTDLPEKEIGQAMHARRPNQDRQRRRAR